MASDFTKTLEELTIAAYNTPGGGAPLQAIRSMLRASPPVPIYPILTALRTGTWWNSYFLYYYASYLRGVLDPPVPLKHQMFYDYRDTLGGVFVIGHSLCPGYALESHTDEWNALSFSLPGYNFADAALRTLNEFVDPQVPANPGVVFLYRNPLDHFVSMFEHGRRTGASDFATGVGDEGEPVALDTPFLFAKHHGVQCYLKIVLSYRDMARKHPGRVKIHRYEEIVENPEHYFREVLSFFNLKIDARALQHALAASSKPRLGEMERRTGVSLANGTPSATHFGNGAVGKWREAFSAEEVDYIEGRFRAFGLSALDLDLVAR